MTIRVIRDIFAIPGPGTRIIDDGRVRKLDGAVLLNDTDRLAVEHDGLLLILDRGSRNLTDQDAIKIAANPPSPNEREPRNLQERIDRAIRRKIATTHKRVPCIVCGAQERQRCVHREPGHPPVELDEPHQARIEADR